eukprot:TRINITY_DN4182_c0_g1_i1.p1 TRINITY_DN4182_c0_g1~~TRINITY_DN4182_c0_g1_i1.p1  ORF type:complete len:316 (+),score=35.37 TRINITY_DN4182_c0_g1_i1:126-950(+)
MTKSLVTRSLLNAATPVITRSYGLSVAVRGMFTVSAPTRVARLPLTTLRRTMFIRTDSTPNPLSLKFFPGRTVLEQGAMEFRGIREANVQHSPLAKRLFAIEGVESLYFAKDFISVNKTEDAEWQVLKPNVFATLMDFFASGVPVYTDELPVSDTTILDSDSETVAMIKELIDTRIRPVVQEDGGDLVYRGFEDGVVLLQMQGSCKGCPSSSVTLRNGIENMLLHYVPEVKGVRQVEDEELKEVSDKAMDALEGRLKSAKAHEQKHVHDHNCKH